MLERDGFPAGVPAWIDTRLPSPEDAVDFYGRLFGWAFDNRPAGAGSYFVATLDGRLVSAAGSRLAGAPSMTGWTTYIGVADADASAAKVRDAGGTVLAEPTELGDAARIAVCADPAGAAFGLWEPGSMKGAQVVNSPNSWNFSELHTRDIDGAKRFYSTVLGWEVDEVDMGALAGQMVRLPGYADFLEQFDPELRKRHADFGAPPGFSECVAWIHPLSGDDASPCWNVTFTVANADEVAHRARELGGSVVVEPFDIAPVRSAVLRDPAGAQFTVSAFNPG